MISTLVSPQILSEHLSDPAWQIVDCRFDLTDPGWGLAQYLQGHIPGAVYAHLNDDLSAPLTPQTGRHPLPTPTDAARQLAALGLRDDSQIVAYDHLGGAYAARLWWMLHWLGHPAAAVLDGGWPAWLAHGGPVHTGEERSTPGQITPVPQPGWTVDADQVNALRQDLHWRLVDARTPIRYRGEQEPIDPVAGHIPGALNRFHGENLGPDGNFLTPETLREQFSHLLGNTPPEQAIMYCGSGVTSCHHILAMEVAGMPGANLYAGSWSEWIRDPNRPRSEGSAS